MTVDLPPARPTTLEQTCEGALGWILVNRDGPRIQPGARTYERSWIRDGALTATALARDRLRATRCASSCAGTRRTSSPDGTIPCCVDARGADPTPEHDSDGEFVYAIAEYYR